MGNHPSGSYIYRIQRIILQVFFWTTSIALAVPISIWVNRLSPNQLYPLVITLLLYTILVIIVAALIHVISYIPFNLAHAFDPIQNDVASHRISSMDELERRICLFTVQFFDFSFLDISHAFIHIDGSDITGYKVNEQVLELLKEYQMLETSQKLEGITRAGEIKLPEGKFQIYILPIIFEDRWLGYMALLSRSKISSFFQRFLMEYEDDFLDDQIMHLLHHDTK